ncbi:MAG TPA: hypothetical protein VGJ62_00835 [Gemmatimonadaceae bacterium]
MSSPPDRPFVPHRTPKAAKPITGQADFRLSRPFVPGAAVTSGMGAIASDATVVAGLATAPTDVHVEIPPIDEILKRPNASRDEAPVSIESVYESELLEAVDELPPIEHFLDPLPEIAAFAPRDDEAFLGARESAFGEFASSTGKTSEGSETDWIETDWQQYDWRSAAALGESGVADVEASNAWAETDWEARPPGRREQRQTAADAIATALDQIAQRIRNGDLAVPSPGAVTDPSAIAVTLAALLGVRR